MAFLRQMRIVVRVIAALALPAGALAAVPAQAHAAPAAVRPPSPGHAVPVTRVLPKKIPVRDGTHARFRATELTWPQPGTTQVSLRAGAVSRVAGSPVWIEPAAAGARPATSSTAAAGTATAAVPVPAATVTVLPRSAATSLGVSGIVLHADAPAVVAAGAAGTASAGPAPGAVTPQVRIGVDYQGFAQEYGGDFGSRLTLVALPACALTTPGGPACRAQRPLQSVNDPVGQSVSAQVPLGTVLALTSTPAPEGAAGGSYSATSLKPAESWNEGGDSGSFDYRYPVTLPGASSALVPSVDLSYDSQGVDGQTATTQAQSSWVGDGWTTPDSFVEQTFTPCADSPEGVTLSGAQSTYDECYGGPVLTLSLNGTSTALVCNADESSCTEQADHGATVSHVASSHNGSGTYNTDYWVVTERDGTAYYFGRNQLPGYATGDQVTNSVDSMPVYSRAKPADPCASAAGQVCTMAYRWHLDYVTNLTGQAMAYYYAQQPNYYGENNGAASVSYIRDSRLAEIDYGFAGGDAYGSSAPVPDKVIFTPSPAGRCVAATCDPLTPSLGATKAGSEYPDVPYDLICAQGATCGQHSPSFFSTDRLASIITEQYSAGSYPKVDEYDLTQTEPPTGDTTNQTLWLASVQRTGYDTSAGGTGTVTPPPVTFGGTDLPNRVDTTNWPALDRWRLTSVTSELGAVTTITYETPATCTAAWARAQTAATAASSTRSCYPVYWAPSGTMVMDWFESYAVKQVTVSDSTGGALPQETDYAYGPAAWHYDDNEVIRAKYRTYGQFRGYATVTTDTGQPGNDPQTEQVDTYYQGMDGDYRSSTATRSVTLKDTAGGTHPDSAALAGDVLESRQYLGSGGPVETDAITSYWVSAPAQSRSRDGLPDLVAQATGAAETWTAKTTSDGGKPGTVVTETDTTYDAGTGDDDFGLATYSYTHTDPVNAAYDSCTTTQYAPVNKAVNLSGLVSYTETDSAACSGYTPSTVSASMPSAFNTLTAPPASAVSAPAHVESATQTFYGDPSFATAFPQQTAPSTGEVTMVRKASGYSSGAFTWQTGKRSTYDGYGRVTRAWDANGNETTTGYAVSGAGLTTGQTVTQPPTSGVAHVTSKTTDPTRGLTLTATDANGVVTTERYDALGRLTSVWENSRPTSQNANLIYTYTVSATGDSGVTTQTMNDAGGYATSVAIDDSLGRPRQTQMPTPQGGRLISDTLYDSRGWTDKKNTGYWDSTTTPALGLVAVADNEADTQDDYVLDGLGRVVQDLSKKDGNLVSTTTTVYNGDATTVIPPGKGTIKTTVTDPLGRVSKLIEYTATPAVTTPSDPFTGSWSVTGGSPSAVTYGYDGHGNRDSATDAAGNQWTETYNLLGQQTAITDADAGTTTMTYDPDGNPVQSRDSTGAYLSFTYDALGRKTAEYAAPASAQAPYSSPTSAGNELASWVYDNASKATDANGNPLTDTVGHATTVTSYSGGYPYTEQSLGFNVFGESKGTSVTIPAAAQGTALGTTWTIKQSYTTATGLAQQTSYPQGGGLPQENVTYTYTSALDLPSGIGSSLPLTGYAQSTSYTDRSQIGAVKIGGTAGTALINDTYNPHTGQLTDQLVTRSTTPSAVNDTSYAYDPSGLLTGLTEARLGSTATAETQCYAYTTQDQLSAAWTATDNCAATPTATAYSTVGDPLDAAGAYWESFGYDSAGDRKSQRQYTPAAGGVSTTSYAYNGNASASVSQPTTLTAVSTTGAAPASASYSYYANGEQKTRTAPGGPQTLQWNNARELTSVSTGTTTDASYIYDADGNLLLQADAAAGTTTLYLPGEQLTSSAGGTTSGVRYYPLPGGATAVRTGTGSSYYFEIGDQHGTSTSYLDYTAQVPAWRQFDPFGNPRGATAAWIDNRGFLGKVADPASSLTDVGARWYDPATGAFVSVDPLLEASDPTQLGGYDYAGNDPVSASDPSGKRCEGEGCESWTPDPPSGGGGGGGGGGSSSTGGGTGSDQLSITYDPIGAGLVYDDPTDPEFWEFAMRYAEAGAHLENRPDLTPLENELRRWGWVCENSDICGGGFGSMHSQIDDLAEAASTARMTGQPEPPGLEQAKLFLNRPDPVSPNGPTGFVMDPGMDFGKPTGPFKIILEASAESNAEKQGALTDGANELDLQLKEFHDLNLEAQKASEEGHTGQVVAPVPWGGPANGATQSAVAGGLESVAFVCAVCYAGLKQPVANFIKSVGLRVFGMDGAGDGGGDAAGMQEPQD